MKRWIIFAAILLLSGVMIWFNASFKPRMINEAIRGGGPPVAFVSAQPAEKREWQPSLRAVGTVEAVQGVVLSPRESGIVTSILFESGQIVDAGTLLVQIDDEAQRADVNLFEATLRNAELELKRDRQLVESQAVSVAVLDRAIATRDGARAELNRARARVEDQAIRAPFAGRLGIRRVNIGQYLNPGDPIVSLQTLDPIYVTFQVPENDIGKVAPGMTINAAVDAHPDTTFTGQITSLDAAVNENTRSISVQATLRNPDGLLTPGMFANVSVTQPTQFDVVTVPQTAIAYSLAGDTVWVLKPLEGAPDRYAAERRKVKPRQGDQGDVAIDGDVRPGDLVVTAGQQKIRPGWQLAINNDIVLARDDALPRQ
ncbi:MAG: efflux RND transporter periplasmic adaptor subunit [Pseudomonadota bacterium]